MNRAIELVFKHKFENLSGPETFPVIITTLHNDFSLPASYFTLFPWLYTVKCVAGLWWWEGLVEGGPGEDRGPSHVPVPEEIAACQPTCLGLSHCIASSLFHLVILGNEQHLSPTPPRCYTPRTFFPPYQLLPAPQSSSKRKRTWKFEVKVCLVTRQIAEQ